MLDDHSKEDVFQKELYKLIYYLQASEYSSTTRRDMLEDVITNLKEQGCLEEETHFKGISNLLEEYKGSEKVRFSLSSLPTRIDPDIGLVNLIFWVKD